MVSCVVHAACAPLKPRPGTEYFLAGCLALPLIERLGRRKLLLTGAIGCSICMAVIAGCVSTGIIDAEGAPVLAPAPGITAVTFIFRECGGATGTANADLS